jgi:hypothetical protein
MTITKIIGLNLGNRNMACSKFIKLKMPKYFKYLLFGLIFLTLYSSSKGQQIGFDFSNGEKKVTIKFERYNNLIVIPILVNNLITLKFILDTGVQYPILTEKRLADILNFSYSRRIVIESPGISDSISALVSLGVSLKLPGGIKSGMNQALLVLEEDYLQLKKNLGADIYGIIGYSIFSRFIVEIDNENLELTLHEPSKYRPSKFATRLPMQIVNTKPYINTTLHMRDSLSTDLKMLIDTGASHALLLDKESDGIFLPNKFIHTIVGRGIGGDIHGFLGRVDCFSIGKFQFDNPISSFPVDGAYGNAILRGSRNGTIGGEILTRFNLVFDYGKSILYIKKNSDYKRTFEHDMSGMNLIVIGPSNNQMKVDYLKKGSPAELAGLKIGDMITDINGYDMYNSSFNHIISLLRMKDGKKINAKVLRNDEPMKFTFKLSRVI